MKMRPTTILLLVFFQALCIDVTLSTLPGFKLRLSKKGLDYANVVAHTALGDGLRNLKISDQSGHDGHLDWSLTSVQNRGVTIPSSSMNFDPSVNGLTWALSNLGINLHADWRVKYKKWISISTSGSVDLNIKGVSLQVTIHLGVQSGGRPNLSMAKCSASIGDVDVHFHGGTAWILNLFRGMIGKKIKDLMQGQICKVVEKEINVEANAKLSQIKVNVDVAHRFLLDYSLVTSPTIHSMDLETQHKGEAYWKADKKEAPFSPKPIPALPDESHMMYLWVTDYLPNSAAYNAQTYQFLQYNLTQKDFPAGNKSILNTTCSKMCVGKLIPQISKLFPNSVVEARLKSLQAPHISMTTQGLAMTAHISADLFAHTPNKTTNYLVSLDVKITFSLKGAIVDERLTGQITSNSLSVTVTKSAVGQVSSKGLNFLLNLALDMGIIPHLNDILKKGVDLPITGNVSFKNTQLISLNGAMLIATDFTAKATPVQ